VRIYEDLRVVQQRLAVLQALVVVLIAALVVQFWTLQVVRARHFAELAESNRSRLVRLAAPRGALLDRNGKVLVENRPAFTVLLNTEHLAGIDRTVSRLAGTLEIGEAVIRERLARRQPYRPVVVKTDATLADVAALEARRKELPEVSVEVVPLRSYPLASAAAHTLGRVGEISERQLQLADFRGLAPGSLVGQAGLESRYNRQLMGKDGYRRVIVDSRGLEVEEAEHQSPEDGPALTLTIDAGLQAAMEEAFAGRAGAAVALDPRNGEILAMASTPAYDPNEFTTGIEASLWASLATDPRTPLMNRVIQGAYSPGSTFKIIAATAALEEGIVTPQTTFFCPGQATLYGNVFHCNRAGGHGNVDLRTGNRPAPRGDGAHAEPGVEAAPVQAAVVRGGDGLGRDRPGPGERHASADGPGRRGDRERRKPRAAPPRAGRGRHRPRAPRDQALDDRGGQGRHARGSRRGHGLPREDADDRGGRQDGLRPGRGEGAPREVAGRGAAAAARVVRLLRPRREPDDRPGGARRARPQRHGLGGARRAPDPRPLLRARPAGRPRRGGRRRHRGRRLMAIGVDRRLIYNIDWVLAGAAIVLAFVGVAMVYSATHGGRQPDLYLKQLVLAGVGVVALVVMASVDYRRLADRAMLLYGLSVVSLLYVLRFAPVVAGTRRWIRLAGFQLQPSELVKIAAAIFIAKIFAEYRQESLGLRDILVPAGAVALLAFLIAKEPDLGTAACLFPMFLAVAFLAGLRMRAVAALAAALVLTAALAWPFLKDYQKTRIYTFLDPSLDPRGAGYQKIQSQIAVGSGGLVGRGFLEGSQAQLGYLPARQTDFIFSVLAEETGFLGVSVVLGLYLLVLWRMLETARLARDRLGAFVVAAIAGGFGFQVVYNVAMVAGLVPVKGLPLPLMSYGGSSVLSSLMAVGLVLSVRMRRFAN
jgi:rod shape-determining protein RodA